MRSLILIGLLVATPWAMAAQETRELPAFTSISTKGVYKLSVTAGQPQSVVVTADEEQLARLTTKVVGDNLIISMPDEKNFKWKDKVSIVIGVLQLKRFQLEGVGETTLNQLVGEEFFLKYQGVGSLTLNGKVQRFTARVEGVGTVNAHELDAESADVRLEGIGSAKVRASDSLNVRVEGLGSVTYYGKPAHLTKSAEGFGSIRAAD